MQITGNNRYQVEMVSMDARIDPENPVRVVDAFVESLDLAKLGFVQTVAEYIPNETAVPYLRNAGGRPSYRAGDLLKLYIYGYYNRIRSSRMLERECCRNIELHWLIGGITPNYHTISDFRKDHRKTLKGVFKTFVHFLMNNEMIGGDTAAIDGTKVRAVNSKKRNYNADKVKRQLTYIENKTEEYLKQLDEMDAAEVAKPDIEIKKQEVKSKIEKLKTNKTFYTNMAARVAESPDGQVSTTDPESRALLIRHNQIEVAYNIQCAGDSKHSMITDFDVTNENDSKALYPMAQNTKDILQKSEEEIITVLADTGYHNGEQLSQCEAHGITTLVPPRDYSSRGEIPAPDYLFEKFTYNEQADTYTCPEGNTLTTNGTWYAKDHNARNRRNSTQYKVKHYKTPACKTCPMKQFCTKNKNGRLIERSEYQGSVDSNNARVKANRPLYSLRQQISEHPFGTIKRSWGYYYTLLKGKEKVNGEYAIIFTVYNLRRSVSILGVPELIRRLKAVKKTFFTFFYYMLRQKVYSYQNFFSFTMRTIGCYMIL